MNLFLLLLVAYFVAMPFYKRHIISKANPELVAKAKKLRNDGMNYKEISDSLLKEGNENKKVKDALIASSTYSNKAFDIFNVTFIIFMIAASYFGKLNTILKFDSILSIIVLALGAIWLFLNIYLPYNDSIKKHS